MRDLKTIKSILWVTTIIVATVGIILKYAYNSDITYWCANTAMIVYFVIFSIIYTYEWYFGRKLETPAE
jgi:hypothetical protein